MYLIEKERQEKQWLEEDDASEHIVRSFDQSDAGSSLAASIEKPPFDNDTNEAASFGIHLNWFHI